MQQSCWYKAGILFPTWVLVRRGACLMSHLTCERQSGFTFLHPIMTLTCCQWRISCKSFRCHFFNFNNMGSQQQSKYLQSFHATCKVWMIHVRKSPVVTQRKGKLHSHKEATHTQPYHKCIVSSLPITQDILFHVCLVLLINEKIIAR